MSNFQIPEFFGSPIANQMGAEQLVAANYQNMLTKQAMQDAADEKAGYESAYNAMLKPRQQAAQGEQVESTPAIDALYGAPQPTLQDQPNRLAMPEPPMAPQGSSAAYIQGSQKANALFQKQQFDYYNQNIAPVMQYMIQNGMNKEYQDLKQQLKGTQNPIAGYASFMANAMGDSELPAPGKIENIPMTEELRPILASMTEHNPALKAAVAAIPVGQNFGIKMTGNTISEINEPKLGATGAVKWQRKKRHETDDKGKVWEVTVDFNPNTREEKEVSRIPLSDVAKSTSRGRFQLQPSGAVFDRVEARTFYPERDAKGNIVDSRLSADEIRELNTETKAGQTGLNMLTKQDEASKSFIATIDKNIDQFKQHVAKVSQTLNLDNYAVMNMPIRKFLAQVKGDSNIAIYDMLINAISTENAKLVSGGAGSVAQVGEGARIKMDKIHNSNMPVSEMLKLLEATRREGQSRIDALRETKQGASKSIRDLRKNQKDRIQTEQAQQMSGESVAKYKEFKSKALAAGHSIDEINKVAIKRGWIK